jgi:FkbM family methyltransferase
MNFIKKAIKLARLLKDLKTGKASISYSQQAEDLTIQRYFTEKTNGFFVDIGAFDPVHYSNTFLFYQKGWRGINIEPNPEHFNRFTKKRTRDINLNIGINDKNENLEYFKLNAPALNSFSKEQAELWANRPGFKIVGTQTIETFPLKDILNKYLPVGQTIDFMNIDAEGLDLKVIQSNDWNKFRPEFILIEESIYDMKSFDESTIVVYLKEVNYNLVCITGGTMIFKRNK